jgi:DNA-binding NarL/FixJ family response regulator
MSALKNSAQKPAKTKILIVDDHPIVREHLTQLICQHDDLTVCGEADDVSHALAAVERLKPDLIIIDIALRGEYGTDLIKHVRDEWPQLPMLVLSMHEEPMFVERALRAGARGYLTKHEATSNVSTAIRSVLSGRIYLSEEMASTVLGKLVKDGKGATVSPITLLSDRELQILRRIGEGLSNRKIADEMHLSIKTIEAHCARIKVKLNVRDASELLQYAIQWARDGYNV